MSQGKTPGEKKSSGRGQRDLRVRVKSAKGRKLSSTLWLERQLNDPYVARAKREGYRGRAAYKILELDDKYRFLVPGARVVDLGCAPGGWCQVAVARVNALGETSGKKVGRVLGVDLQEVDPIAGAVIHQLDFLSEGADDKVKEWLGGRADVVMSDMAAASSGHKGTDHLRIVALVEAALQLAFDVLEPGGTFVAKVLAGGAENDMQAMLKRSFTKVANVKPPASRSDSSEKFVVAQGFRGRDPLAAPGLVLPGPPARLAERRTAAIVEHREFGWIVDRLRSGPPVGFFRLGWVRDFPSLNEFFVHHEDVRRANGLGSREDLPADLQVALWRNVERGSRYLSRRVRGIGVDIIWGTQRCRARPGDPVAELSGAPGELLLYLFGRQTAARVDVLGPPEAVAAVQNTRFGM